MTKNRNYGNLRGQKFNEENELLIDSTPFSLEVTM